MKNVISLSLFLIFLTSYASKLVVLYKRDKINANVLGKRNKESSIRRIELFVKITTFSWGVMWCLVSVGSIQFYDFIGKSIDSRSVNYIGILSAAIGETFFIIAMRSMKTSWRVGIDKFTKTRLVNSGIYKFSRNPAFVGFDLMFSGIFLMYPGFLTLLILILNMVAIHLLILQEEKHLKVAFNDEYMNYINKTPRYILF